MLFYCDAIFVANLRTFLAYNLQAKKCGGVQKMTNIRYDTKDTKTRKIGIYLLSFENTFDYVGLLNEFESSLANFLVIPGNR